MGRASEVFLRSPVDGKLYTTKEAAEILGRPVNAVRCACTTASRYKGWEVMRTIKETDELERKIKAARKKAGGKLCIHNPYILCAGPGNHCVKCGWNPGNKRRGGTR